MASEQRDYYRGRADEERDAAASAPNASLARVHEDLAAMYDRMARRRGVGRWSRLTQRRALDWRETPRPPVRLRGRRS